MPELPTLIIISDPNMGDAICAMHVVQIMAAQRQHVYLSSLHPEVELLMRPAHVKGLAEIPRSEMFHVKHLSIHNAFRQGGRYHASPQWHYLREAGIHVDSRGPFPKPQFSLLEVFNYDTNQFDKPEVPKAELVVAPFTKDQGRLWSLDMFGWNRVIRPLLDEGIKITVVGGPNDPEPWPWKGVEYYYGRSLDRVAYMMKHASIGTLTIDSGPSRLAQVVGAPNHIVLSPVIYPKEWVAEPTSTQIRSEGPQPIWDPEEIINAVLHRV